MKTRFECFEPAQRAVAQNARFFAAAASAVSLCLGCAFATEEDLAGEAGETGVESEAITGGQDVPAGSRYGKSTVGVLSSTSSCTGTIVGRRHVLTAAHCGMGVGSTIVFYSGALPTGATATVVQAYAPFGVSSSDLVDNNNKFADFVVLNIGSDFPATSQIAKLATQWPGNNVDMAQVGRGRHDGLTNFEQVLRYRINRSYAASDAAGHVLYEGDIGDPGDSGGPYYRNFGSGVETFAVHSGPVFEWAMRDKATSVAFHVVKIMQAIGLNVFPGSRLNGSIIQTLTGVNDVVCWSHCLANSSCLGISHTPATNSCQLRTGSGRVTQSGTNSITKMISAGIPGTGPCNSPSGGFCRL